MAKTKTRPYDAAEYLETPADMAGGTEDAALSIAESGHLSHQLWDRHFQCVACMIRGEQLHPKQQVRVRGQELGEQADRRVDLSQRHDDCPDKPFFGRVQRLDGSSIDLCANEVVVSESQSG